MSVEGKEGYPLDHDLFWTLHHNTYRICRENRERMRFLNPNPTMRLNRIQLSSQYETK